jgi:hypothetical protein
VKDRWLGKYMASRPSTLLIGSVIGNFGDFAELELNR